MMQPMVMQFPPFHIDEADYNSGNIVVRARSPSGKVVPLKIGKDSNGQFTTNFVPDEIGDWSISICSNNRPIKGSPFTVRVYDGDKVKVFGLEGGEDGTPVSFTVDTTKAGSGKLSVEVTKENGSSIEASIREVGKKHKVRFDPTGPGVYTVRVFYATVEVPGSPFQVTIVDTRSIRAHGEGLRSAMVSKVASFCVDTGKAAHSSAEVTVNVTSSTGAPVTAFAKPIGPGVYEVNYIPDHIGKYTVAVGYGGKAIPNSPFTVDVFGLDHVRATSLTSQVAVNKTALLLFEAKDTGTADPEVSVNGGGQTFSLRKFDHRKFEVSFSPEVSGPYYIDVLLYGEHIPGSPFLVKAFDGGDVTTTLQCVKGVVKSPLRFDVNSEPFKGNVNVQVFSPTRTNVNCRLTKTGNFLHNVEFVPSEQGVHEVHVTFEDIPIRGSPFMVPVANPGGVVLSARNKSLVLGQTFHMSANTTKAGLGELAVRATGMGDAWPIEGNLTSAGVYDISFTPPFSGQYFIEVDFDCKPLPESPISVMVYDISGVTVSGDECTSLRVGDTKTIHVDTSKVGTAELEAKLTTPGSKKIPVTITGSPQKGYDVTFCPKETGPHQLDLTYGDVDIASSPILFVVHDASKIRVSGLSDGVVNRTSNFFIDLNNSGEGEVEVVVLSASGSAIPNDVKVLNGGKLDVRYVPVEAGELCIDVTFNNEHVPGSPFKLKAFDTSLIRVEGEGVERVQVGEVAFFCLRGNNIRASELEVLVKGPKNSRHITANLTEAGANKVNVEYLPKNVGEYEVVVEYMGTPVVGSPFVVQAWDISKVFLCKLNQAYVGSESNFNIEMKDAGDGTVEISILDPSGQLIPNQVSSTYPGVLQVVYTPLVSGLHSVVVEFNGVRVNGTPRQVNVVNPDDVSVKGEGVGSVQNNAFTNFTIAAPDATLRDIDVKITDPYGKEIPCNVVERGGNFRVEYTPTTVGNYLIDVCAFNTPIRDSPFVSKVWDHRKVAITDQCAIQQACVENSFKVLVGDAGEGVCEVVITDPNGNMVPSQLVDSGQGFLQLFYKPVTYGQHKATVLFNEKFVPGSPFNFLVIDADRITCKVPSNGYVPVQKMCSFTVTSPMAKISDVDFQVIGPNESEISSDVSEVGNNVFKVDFTPEVAGEYRLAGKYFDCPRPLCSVKAWDISKVFVGCIAPGKVDYESTFDVDLRDAGEGSFEVSIENDRGQLIENSISSDGKTKGLYHVTCIPAVSCCHKVNVLFNRQHVKGSPFSLQVCDPSQISVEGEGLHVVRCNRPTGFYINGPEALSRDVHCLIQSPTGNEVKCKVTGEAFGKFACQYTPTETGEHLIYVKYFDVAIKDSPFLMLCWDPANVKVDCIAPSIVSRPTVFFVNTREAGAGNLEVLITANGELVRSSARSVPDTGVVEVMFTPMTVAPHLVNVTFNGEPVPGSPYRAIVLDGSQAYAKGPGLSVVRVGEPTMFNVSANAVGCDANLEVYITSPSGVGLPCNISGSYHTGYTVQYIPVDAGEHRIRVLYADSEIKDSPFCPCAFDPDRVVLLDRAPFACLNKPTSFRVDATRAGPGRIAVTAQGIRSQPHVELSNKNNIYTATFRPTEPVVHDVTVLFNDMEIMGSPFKCNVVDETQMRVLWESRGPRPVGEPVFLSVDSQNVFETPLQAYVVDSFGRTVDLSQQQQGDVHNFQFTPMHVGTYMLHVSYGCDVVPGSPFKCETYDVERVRVLELEKRGCIGDEVFFTVDTSEAGPGLLDVQVACNGKAVRVGNEKQALRNKFSFKADCPCVYTVDVFFNGVPVPGSPFEYCVENPACLLTLSSGNCNAPVGVGCVAWAVLAPPKDVKLHAEDCDVTVIGPYDEQVIASRKSLLPNGNVKIEYSSSLIGLHAIRVSYSGEEVPGSPCLNQVFDPNAVIIEGSPMGEVGQQMVLEVRTVGAGDADLEVKLSDPSNADFPHSVERTDTGYNIIYVPTRPGSYKVNVVYGCFNVPGCPIRQEIRDIRPVKASGDGLVKGMVAKTACFNVDTMNQMGELVVTVRGPSCQLECMVTPLPDKNFRVEYEPVEAGTHTVDIFFNNQVVQCTFHPKVCDPMLVTLMDIDACWLQEDHLVVTKDQPKSIPFDTSNAGPGTLTVLIDGPSSSVPCDVINYPNGATLKFTPRHYGKYVIRAYYNDCPTRVFPIVATCEREMLDVAQPPVKENSYVQNCDCASEAETEPKKLPPEPSECDKCGLCNGCGGFLMLAMPPLEYEPDDKPSYPYEVQANHLPHNIDRLPTCQCHQPSIEYPVYYSHCDEPFLPMVDESRVVVSGPGLSMVRCRDQASFMIDGSMAGPGVPTVSLQSIKEEIPVMVQQIDRQLYGCSYVAVHPGAYLLTVWWNDRQISSSPIKVTVLPRCDPSKVSFSKECLMAAQLEQEVSVVVDCRRAGHGCLKAMVQGPSKQQYCEIDDRKDGVFEVVFKPTEPGTFHINILYDGCPVPESPFCFMVGAGPDASKVRVFGQGLQNGLLATFDSSFTVDTRGAGQGQLNVKVRGKKGTFHVEMNKDPYQDRVVLCQFHPTEVGEYYLNVFWSNNHVPGSPFRVLLVDTLEELNYL